MIIIFNSNNLISKIKEFLIMISYNKIIKINIFLTIISIITKIQIF